MEVEGDAAVVSESSEATSVKAAETTTASEFMLQLSAE